MALKSALQKQFVGSDFSFDYDFKKGAKEQNFDIASIAKMIALADSSDEVYKAIFTCLARCTYNGEKITKQVFEPANARQDYYDIIFACAKENVAPFFESLISKWLPVARAFQTNMQNQTENSQK